MKTTASLLIIYLIISTMTACNKDRSETPNFMENLTFYASFDHGFEADYAAGDPLFYTSPSLRRAAEEFSPYEPGGSDPDEPDADEPIAEILENRGRFGHALQIQLPYEPILFYRGHENMAYQSDNWSGSVSFWMNLDAGELAPGFSDPIQITSRGWNDGALFVDFTDEEPRIFRYALFPDREVWDPEERDWDEVPPEERPMIDVPEHPFTGNEWVHVAFTFTNFNTGRPNGIVHGYLNGEHAGSLTGREKTISWNTDRVVIWLGYNFRGLLDEIALFDRALSDEEVWQLYEMNDALGAFR